MLEGIKKNLKELSILLVIINGVGKFKTIYTISGFFLTQSNVIKSIINFITYIIKSYIYFYWYYTCNKKYYSLKKDVQELKTIRIKMFSKKLKIKLNFNGAKDRLK